MYFFYFFLAVACLAHSGFSLRLANARRAGHVVLEFGPDTRSLTVTLLQADATNKKAQFLKRSSIRHMYYQYVLFFIFFLAATCPGPPRCLTASRQCPPRCRRRARVWPGHPLAHRHAATGRCYHLHCQEGP